MSREIRFRAWDNKNKKWLGDFCFEQGRYHTMQYTDLKDKNGKEIYEGDIVCVRYSGGPKEGKHYIKAEVKWGVFNIGSNGYEYDFFIVGPHVEDEFLYNEMIAGDVEIIGNIYENPELLNES